MSVVYKQKEVSEADCFGFEDNVDDILFWGGKDLPLAE